MKKLSTQLTGAALVLAMIAGTQGVRAADSPTDNWSSPNSNLLKAANWSTGKVPAANVIGVINDVKSTNGNVLGLEVSSNPKTASIGALELTGGTNEKVGTYSSDTSASNDNLVLTLAGATLNSQAHTVIANENSGTTFTFQNDAQPSDKNPNTGQLTLALGNSTNVIQSSGSGNDVIINVGITGSNDALTFLGGGTSSVKGGTLELGAGTSADSFGATNTFSGGLTVGSGSANAGIVKVDGAKALPTTGAVTVNANSQLILNGSATYGGTTQTLTLNGNGTGGSTNGALTTGTADTSTLQTTVSLATASAINAQGTSKLTFSGQITGSGLLTSVGTGTVTLTHANNYSGGTTITGGSFVADNTTVLGTGKVTVAGGKLTSLLTTTTNIGALALNSGSIALNATALPTFSLASVQNLSMTGGTLSLTDVAGTVGSISGLNGSFSITGGTLDLGNSFIGAAYNQSYDILSGFSSGSVADLNIINYDTTHFTAEVTDNGVLTFDQVPEPSTYALLFGSIGFLGFLARRKAVRPDSMI